MRHQKHSNQLGVKKEHRAALMANLAAALIREGRIQTTLKKAKALRPFAERLVTLAKKGGLANRRLALARVRDEKAIATLFDERAGDFAKRNGGYTRIYKLATQRRGDAAEMALIEWVGGEDPGYRSTKRRSKTKAVPAAESEQKPETAEETKEQEPAAAEPEAKEEGGATAEESTDKKAE